MTSREKVLAVHEKARSAWIPWDGDDPFGMCQIVDGITDKVLGEAGPRADNESLQEFEEAAWQNAAESLPAAPEQVENTDCANCGHPRHISVDGTQSCGLCCNEYGLGKRTLDKVCSHYLPVSAEPKPTPSTWLKCVYCGRFSEGGKYHEQQCDSPVGYKPQPEPTFEEWWDKYAGSPEFYRADDAKEMCIATWNAAKGQG